jgi:hypothetical protein
VLCFSSSAIEAQTNGDAHSRNQAGLGKVLTTKDGGQIFGFDIDREGDDGLLATAMSVEVFDQNSGKITKLFGAKNPARNSYRVDAILAGDVGLITHYVMKSGHIYPRHLHDVMNPVTANKFTGTWTPSKHVDVQMAAQTQGSSTSALFVTEISAGQPDLIVSDVANNVFSNDFHLDPNLFVGGNGPRLAQFTATNQAVFALSADGGEVGGDPPVNVLIDMNTGKSQQFSGYNNGMFHAGYVNGVAVDPNTGIAATTTELNAQVEFYDLAKKTGIAFAQLPCTNDTDQTQSGSGVTADPVNKLFLVSETSYCDGTQGSAIVVYDESGNFVEAITGFNFTLAEPAAAINPGKRMGWAFNGPGGVSQLQQFFY